jgi:putative methionine-R-sulfoxide reductase with GAF domain
MADTAFAEILGEVKSFAETTSELTSLQNFIVELIPSRLAYYNWTGFYMLDPPIQKHWCSGHSVVRLPNTCASRSTKASAVQP